MVRPRSARRFLDLAADQRLGEAVGIVEDGGGVVEAQVAGGKQVAGHREITTPSSPSLSRNNTCTLSLREVGTFLPT